MGGIFMIKPLYDRVVVEMTQNEKKTASGIVLPGAAQEEAKIAVVVAKGEGRMLENGIQIPVCIEIGQQILFTQYAGVEIEHEGKKYLVLHEKDIIAVIE